LATKAGFAKTFSKKAAVSYPALPTNRHACGRISDARVGIDKDQWGRFWYYVAVSVIIAFLTCSGSFSQDATMLATSRLSVAGVSPMRTTGKYPDRMYRIYRMPRWKKKL
jgi:hypothetical protein